MTRLIAVKDDNLIMLDDVVRSIAMWSPVLPDGWHAIEWLDDNAQLTIEYGMPNPSVDVTLNPDAVPPVVNLLLQLWDLGGVWPPNNAP